MNDRKFIPLPRNPERDELIRQCKLRFGGVLNASSIGNAQVIEFCLRYVLANWEVVQEHNPDWRNTDLGLKGVE